MPQVPDIFASILATKKEDPLVKYRYTFAGASPADVASIDQGKAFIPILANEIASRHLPLPLPRLVAGEGVPAADKDGKPIPVTKALRFHTAEAMLADGFPSSQLCRLFFVFESGEKAEEEGEGLGISDLKKARIFEAADFIRNYFTRGFEAIAPEIKE